MNAPGLVLGLSSRDGTLAARAHGLADLASRTPLNTGHLFQIGSITKSFTALVVLQLQDEGKLDVQQPILRYLPSLPVEMNHGEILIHHLLTHSSGMPDNSPVYAFCNDARIRQSFKPGTRFHYSNWGFNVLGHLVAELDHSSWPESLSRRILAPLGMSSTVAAITSATRARIVQGYLPLHDDRPYPRNGPLVPAGNLTFVDASGCIASTASDMTQYMTMLANRGVAGGQRIVSERAFELFAEGHIDAPPFGAGARYGYGIAVDQLDGHTRLRHTGGMPAFMSSLQVDLQSGFGAFASINAYQDYRPNALTQFALRLLRAGENSTAVPMAAVDEWPAVTQPDDYAGTYLATDGRRLEVRVQAGDLMLQAGESRTRLDPRGDEQFIAAHPQFELFRLLFSRASAAQGNSRRPVVGLAYGPDWYARLGQESDAGISTASSSLAPYPGFYHSDTDPTGAARIVERRGQLWIDGTTPLRPIGDALFQATDEPESPETVEFRHVVAGQAQVVVIGGQVLPRVAGPTDT